MWAKQKEKEGRKKSVQVIKKKERNGREKKTIKTKLMLRTIVWYFSNGWLFLPFTLLQVNYANMVHAWYRKTASITEHITVVLAIPYTTTMGGEGVGTVIHILAHITGKLVCIVPVTPETVFFFFFFCFKIKQWEQLRLKWKEPIHNRGHSLDIEITCACSIGNKVLVIGNTNVRYSDGKTQALHPQAHAGLSWSRAWPWPWARPQRGVAVRHGSTGSSLSPVRSAMLSWSVISV